MLKLMNPSWKLGVWQPSDRAVLLLLFLGSRNATVSNHSTQEKVLRKNLMIIISIGLFGFPGKRVEWTLDNNLITSQLVSDFTTSGIKKLSCQHML